MSEVGQKTLLADLRIPSGMLEGIKRGVVEDNNYPGPDEKHGQCRVRILGVHSDNKNAQTDEDGIPTDELPWAQQVTGLSGNATSSIPQIGAYVFVFFEDGNPMQPRYFGIAPGTEKGNKKAADPNVNMCNPEGVPAGPNAEVAPDFKDCALEATLVREHTDDTGTTGTLTVRTKPADGSQGMVIFTGKTLELPWRNNASGKSCFPKGTYKCSYTVSGNPRLTKTYRIDGTPGRAGCRFHQYSWAGDKSMGFRSDVEGCVLVGTQVVANADNGRGKRQKKCENTEQAVRNLALFCKEQPFVVTVTGVCG